jgi:1,4-dihydroxy-2-naphthoate octaprenyltransferase
MQIVERRFASTQPVPRWQEVDIPVDEQERLAAHPSGERPKTIVGEFARLTRASAAIAVTFTALCGAVLAWWEWGLLQPVALLYMLTGVLAMVIGFSLLGDRYDFLGRDEAELPAAHEPYFSGYSFLIHGMITPRAIRIVGRMLIFLSFLCTLLLVVMVGWPMLFFAGVSWLLGYTYNAPPIRYGARGWGLGELGCFLNHGFVLMLAGYYSQAQTVSWLPIWAAIPFGLLTLAITYNFNAVYYRRDWLNRKRTLMVHLGLVRGIDLSSFLVVAAYVAILLTVSLAHLPLWTLVSLAALPVVLGSYGRLRRSYGFLEDYIDLYSATVSAVILTGILFGLALIFDKLL